MKFIRIFLLMAAFLLFFSGCNGGNFENLNSSDSGNMIEQLLPQDTWMMISITTKDAEQVGHFNDLVERFSEENTDDFLTQMKNGFATMGLDYDEDIAPILGDEGFRVVIAYAPSADSDDVANFVGMTISDVEKAQEWLDSLVSLGEATVLSLGEIDAYVSDVEGEESYTALIDDILLVTNSSAALLNAKGQLAAKGGESLMTNEMYISDMEKIKDSYMAYLYVDFDGFESSYADAGLSSGVFAVGSYLLESQVLAFSFEEDALVLSGYATGDKDKIEEVGVGLSDLAGSSAYLYESIPADNLAFYQESGALSAFFQLWISKYAEKLGASQELTEEQIELMLTQYLAMDYQDELMTFLDRAYAVAVHRNGASLIPGISFVIDASSDDDAARDLIDRLDAQVDSLVLLFAMDEASEMALTKTEAEIQGGEFHVVNVDLEAMGIAGSGSGMIFSVPEEVELTNVSLLYGVTDDDFLVISTYEGWEVADIGVSVTDGLDGYDEMVFYLDFSELAAYLGIWENLQDSLSSGLESVVATVEETDWEDLLGVLDDLAFGVKAGDDWIEMKGRLELSSQ